MAGSLGLKGAHTIGERRGRFSAPRKTFGCARVFHPVPRSLYAKAAKFTDDIPCLWSPDLRWQFDALGV